jgi:hypothetical protein
MRGIHVQTELQCFFSSQYNSALLPSYSVFFDSPLLILVPVGEFLSLIVIPFMGC